MSNPYTYTDAFEELQTIVSEIEQGEISIDELAQQIQRATLLISICKAKLTATEEEVNQILSNLGDKDNPTSSGENEADEEE